MAIENINAFFVTSSSNALTNPWNIVILTFKKFNILTLFITIVSIWGLFMLRSKLNKFPAIAFLVIFGMVINYNHYFQDYKDLCNYPEVDCKFYIVKLENMIPPGI